MGRERGVRLAAVWAGWRAADKQDGISRPTRPSAHPRRAGPSAGKPRAPAAPRTRPCARTRRGSAESLALEARLGALRASRHTWAFRLWGPRVGGRERKRLRAPRPRPCSRALAPRASPESSCFGLPRPRGLAAHSGAHAACPPTASESTPGAAAASRLCPETRGRGSVLCHHPALWLLPPPFSTLAAPRAQDNDPLTLRSG